MMLESVKRKVQLTGKATFIVSLPKSWATNMSLKPGDEVIFIPQPDGSLKLTVSAIETVSSKALIEVDEKYTPDDVCREFISYYLAGCNNIEVYFKPGMYEHKRILKEIIDRKMIGVEIIEESEAHVVAQCLVRYAELPVGRVLQRMGSIVSFMLLDAVKALHTRDGKLASEIVERDDEVDRFYLFTVRQLMAAVKNPLLLSDIGISTPSECLAYHVIAKSIERMADHASRIANVVAFLPGSLPEGFVENIEETVNDAVEILGSTLRALARKRKGTAIKNIRIAKEITEKVRDIMEIVFKDRGRAVEATYMALIVESIERVIEYISDIAENVVNILIGES
ncbi:hypothetical protein DRO02_04810 [archaeon]|nr:MAG: hypothetical protein DRO02_04810 [archaeon]